MAFPLYHMVPTWRWGGKVRGSAEENSVPKKRMSRRDAKFLAVEHFSSVLGEGVELV